MRTVKGQIEDILNMLPVFIYNSRGRPSLVDKTYGVTIMIT